MTGFEFPLILSSSKDHPELVEGFRLSRGAQSTFDTATYALHTFSPRSREVHEGFVFWTKTLNHLERLEPFDRLRAG